MALLHEARATDRVILYDSRVITRYLDDLLHVGLYPAPPRLWNAQVIEASGNGIAEAAVLMRHETDLRPEASRLPAWADAQWQKIARAATALGCLDFRHADRDWRAVHPALAAWFGALDARPAMRATAPDA